MNTSTETVTSIPAMMDQLGQAARGAMAALAQSSAESRNAALRAAAESVREEADSILVANQKDLRASGKGCPCNEET